MAENANLISGRFSMTGRKVFTDSVIELPMQLGPTANGLLVNTAKPENKKEQMDLLFSLQIPSKAELEQRVAAGETVSAQDLATKYTPKASDIDALKTWLTKQGFKVTGQSQYGTSVYANADVAQIEQSLNVNMVRVTKNGITYTAAQNAPSVAYPVVPGWSICSGWVGWVS
jgi:kumamolisin